jgi:hypothetical protein
MFYENKFIHYFYINHQIFIDNFDFIRKTKDK